MTGMAVGAGLVAGVALGLVPTLILCGFAVAAWLVLDGRKAWSACALLLIAGVLGAWRGTGGEPAPLPVAIMEAEQVTGRIASMPAAGIEGQRFVLQLTAMSRDGMWRDLTGCLMVSSRAATPVGLGDEVWLLASVETLEELPPGLRSYLRSRECGGWANAYAARIDEPGSGWRRDLADFRERLAGSLRRAVRSDHAALLAGLVTGDDERLSERRSAEFRRTGTGHITAVSGANLALLVGISTTLGGATGWRRRLLWQAVTITGLWTYAVMVGLEPPAMRAAIVASLAVLASRVGRRPDHLTLLVLAAGLMLLIEPADAGTLSFQLSVAASLALTLSLPVVAPIDVAGWTRMAVVSTGAAQLATLPIVLSAFGTLSLTSVPANLLIAPAVAIAFPVAVAAAFVGLILPSLAVFLGFVGWLCAGYIFEVVAFLGGEQSELTVGGWGSAETVVLTGASFGLLFLASHDGRRVIERWRQRLSSPVGLAPIAVICFIAGLAAGAAIWLVWW